MADNECGGITEEEDVYELMIELRRSEPDHRDAVQKKTFTKWINNHLQKVNVRILDLYEELRDGNNLLLLLELLCKTNLPRERGQLRFHRLQNVQTALEFLHLQGVKLVNIRSEDIVDGSPKLTLGLIWTIILYYQISEVEVVGKLEQMTAKDALLLWAQKVTQGYPSVEVANFTDSWKDGLAFNAIIHRYRPDLVDFSKLSRSSPETNLEYSFHVAEKELGVPRLLDVEDLAHTDHPDEKSVMTYVSSLYEIFPKEPTAQETLHDNEKLFKLEEYCNLARALVGCIKRVMQRLEKQRFPKTVQGIKELIVEYNRYRISEFPDMEGSRHSLKMVFRELQALYGPIATWLEFPFECSPRELEVLWTNLVETQDNYNKSLRIELTRLEQMFQVAEKIQKEATLVDASLDDIEERIKSEEHVGDTVDHETRRKHFYQIEKSLVMFESSIKHMISGVDILIAGRYSRADELRIKIHSIEKRWSDMKDRLEARSTKMLTYHTYSSTDSKKMKLELPVEKTVVSTEETTPTSDNPDERGVRTRRKVITITKRTYRSSGGDPTESRTTVARIMSAEGLQDDTGDSGIFYGELPQGRSEMKFSVESGDELHRLNAMLTWIRETRAAIEEDDFGLDLPSAQKHQQNHYIQHEAVLAFQDELKKIKTLEADERALNKKIIEIHEEYAALVKCSATRVNHLKSLVTFMSEATKELIWMNQREEPEVSRDWSRTDLDIEELQAYGENVQFDVREREPHYTMLLTKGDNMVQMGHPAPGPIEAYLNAMRSQWWWLNQLLIAFQQHVRNAEMYQQYFQDAHITEKKMIQLVERLNTEYDVQNISSREAAERALDRLTEMKQELVDFKDIISSLQLLSKKVVPLPQRKSKLKSKLAVEPVCSYKNMQNIVNKGEECLLLDNSEHHSWKITNASGKQCEVPSVCFVIPGPDVEATEFSTRLEIQYKHLLTLWRTRHWNLKQALSKEQVFTQVKVIKSTSPDKGKLPVFAGSKDAEQILRDIQMPDDQEIVSITERLPEQESVTVATNVSLNENPPETFIQEPQTLDKQSAESTLNTLLPWLKKAEGILKTMSKGTLNQGSLSTSLQEVKHVQQQQTQRSPQYDLLINSMVTKMDPELQRKLEVLSAKWMKVKEETSNWHRVLMFWLNVVDLLSEFEDSVRRVEVILIQQPGLTANPKDIQHQIKVLQGVLEKEIQPNEKKVADIRKSLLELKDFDKARVQTIVERWESARHQVDNRLVGLVQADQKLGQFQGGLQSQLDWLSIVEEKVEDRLWSAESDDADKVMEELTALYTDIRSQQVSIKTLCTVGHEYKDESQVWEKNLEEYRRSLHHLPESQDTANPILESAANGRQEIISSLMNMNTRYEKLLNEVQLIMEQLVDTLKRQGKEHKEVEEACLQWCSSIQHLLDWLSDTEKTLLAQSASPADVKQLEQQIEEQKRFTRAVYERKKPVEAMLLESKQFLQGSGEFLSPNKKAELDTKMSILEARWGRLQSELDNRYMRLVRIHEKLTKFEELLHPFLSWLKNAEDQGSAILLNVKDVQGAQEKLLIHKHFVDDVKEHENDLKEVNQSGEDFLHEAKVFHAELERSVATLESADIKTPSEVIPDPNEKSWVLENKLADINERYNRLLLLLSEKGTILDQSWRQLREYDSQASQALPWLNSAEERLGVFMAQPIKSDAAVIQQRINELKAMQTDVNSHQAEIVAVGVLGHSIEGIIRGPEFEHGKTINQRYDELCSNISMYQTKLQSALTTSQNFKDGLDAAIKALNDLKKQIEKLPPVSRNLVELRSQAQQFKVVQTEVNRHGTSVEALNEMFHMQKKKQKESKVKQLNKLWSEVLDRSDTRKEEFKSVFVMIAKDFERWELGMIKRLDCGELVTSDILVFEEKLQHFQDEVEKMRPAFQSVNQGGHELINLEKNKQHSISLETLDRVNKNWQALAIKLLNTAAKFEELQEQTEKFYAVFKHVTVWLDNIEMRLVSLPSVGLDPDVLSSQMKELKTLQDEAVQYKAQIDLLVGLGKVIISITAQQSSESPQSCIEEDLKTVGTRYDKVWKGLESRNAAVETTVLQMEKYRRLVRNISIFLARAEKRLGQMEPVGGDADTIRQQISEHKILQKEITRYNGDAVLLLKIGSHLLEGRAGTAGSDELQEEISNVRGRMEFIVVASNERQRELESMWSTVKNLDESIQSIVIQIKQQNQEIESLMREENPMNLSRRVKSVDHEVSRLMYQLESANESGQEVISHLRDTSQDTRPVAEMVDSVNIQWEQLQMKLQGLRNKVKPLVIEDEIADRAPIIENFSKVSEVLVQNAQSSDAGDLIREVNNVTEALNSIIATTADRRKILEDVEPMAKDYHRALQTLAEVIDEVEIKLNVQRAFGAEPARITEEIEIVKDLRTALGSASQNACLTGDALLNLQDPSTDMAVVRNQMDALSRRVDVLKGKITQFEQHYDEHMRKATEFQLAVESLLAKFARRNEELLGIDIDTTDKQAIKNRIEELEAFCEEIRQQKPLLTTATLAGDWLIRNAHRSNAVLFNGEREKDVIPQNIQKTLDELKENFHDLEGRIRQQKMYLTSLTLQQEKVFVLPVDHQPVQESMDQFITWLSRAEEVAASHQPLKADLVSLKEEEIAHTADRQDMLTHNPQYTGIVQKALEFLNSSKSGPQRDEVSAKLDDIKTRWEELNRNIGERHVQLEEIVPLAQEYHENSQNVKNVVTLAETELGSYVVTSPDVESAKQELQNIKGVLRALEKRIRDVKTMNEVGNDLADKLDKYHGMSSEARYDQQITNERYEHVLLELRNLEQLVEAQVKSSDQFTAALQEFELDLTGVDSAILEETPENESEVLKRQLADLQASKVALAQLRPKLGSLQSTSLALMQENRDNEKFVDATKSKVQSVTDLYCNIEDKIKDRITHVQSVLFRCQGFNEALDVFERWLSDTEKRFQSLGVLSIKPNEIKKQGAGLKMINEDVALHTCTYDDIRQRGIDLLTGTVSAPHRYHLEMRLSDLENRWEKLKADIDERQKNLGKVMPIVFRYMEVRGQLLTWICESEMKFSELTSELSVVSDIHVMAEKQEHLKQLGEDMENHKPVFQNFTSTSECLIGVCHELNISSEVVMVNNETEEVMRRWDAFKAKVLKSEKELKNSNKTLALVQEVMQPMQQVMSDAESILATEPKVGFNIGQAKEELIKVNKMIDVLEKTEIKLLRLSKQVTNNEYIITIIKDNQVMQVRLKERKVKLEKYIRTVEVFQGAGTEIEMKVMGIMSYVSVEIVVTDLENIRDQLQHVQNLEEEVVIHRRKIETMEETGEWIIKENGENPEVISEVHSNINRAKSTINEVSVKLNDRRRRLETALTERQRVFDTFDDFGRRVVKLDKSLTRAKPVSPEFIVIKEQRTCHEVVVREVGRLRPISEYVFPAAESLLAKSEPAPEKEDFESRVVATRTLWEGVRVKSDNRHFLIERVFPLAHNYNDAYRALSVWLRDAEQKVMNLTPVPCDTISLDDQQRTLTALHEDVGNHAPVFDFFMSAATALNNACGASNITEGLEHLKLLNQEVANRWEVITSVVSHKKMVIDSTLKRMKQYEEVAQRLEETLNRAEATLSAQRTSVTDVTKARTIRDKLKTIGSVLDNAKEELKYLNKMGDRLVHGVDHQLVNTTPVQCQLASLNATYKEVVDCLEQEEAKLEMVITNVENFHDAVCEFEAWLPSVSVAVQQFNPIASDAKEIKKQLKEAEEVRADLEKSKPLLLSAEERGQRLVEVCSEELTVDEVLATKVGQLQQAYEILNAAVVDRIGQLQVKLVQFQELDDSVADVIRWLVEMERTLSRQEPIGVQPLKINRQKCDQESLCTEIASELPVIRQVESNGNQMLESMPSGPDRDVLKCKLADISRRFVAVTRKATERKQTLDSIQPLAEQYQDALNAFLPYLDSAEDKLESLKKVPRDEKSVISQKAEAQTLLEGINSHKGVQQLVNLSSKALLEFCQDNSLSVDTSYIIEEVKDVNFRYNKLCRASFDLEKQHRVVEQSVGLYQNALEPAQQTFEEVDDYLESEPAFGLDTEKGKDEVVRVQELIATLEEQKADLEVAELSGPPRVEQGANLAEELTTASQKYDLSVNKLKRQKVRTFWFTDAANSVK